MPNFYSIRHLTQFRYESPVSESVMEARMHPRTEGTQRCLSFQLSVDPRARVNSYRDYLGNSVHHFDVPGRHQQLRILSEALVEVDPPPVLPARLRPDAWRDLDREVAEGDYWEMLESSQFVRPTDALEGLIRDLKIERREDPLTFLKELSSDLYAWFEYAPKSTSVDSPIDHAIETRKGVCQDFTHIMIALARRVRIPARYVSGYVYPRDPAKERSVDGATHAWVEALVPGWGWVGFDPTNNLLAGDRHIRTAIGRDYADVPPTKGLFKGKTASELSVSVRVTTADAPPPPETELRSYHGWTSAAVAAEPPPDTAHIQQQQQQQ